MNENLAALKCQITQEGKGPVASTSKAESKQPEVLSKKRSRKNITDDDILLFEQKNDLSESISEFEGSELEKVIAIARACSLQYLEETQHIQLSLLPLISVSYNFFSPAMSCACYF
jgi:hypothetical protein